MSFEDVTSWGTWEPKGGVLVAARGDGGHVLELGLESGVSGVKIHDFLLEPHHRCPFLFEEPFIFLRGSLVENGWVEL